MSSLAMFGLKSPSLLSFDNGLRISTPLLHNLKKLYRIKNVPSDTQMRVILTRVRDN